ncbi:hypothetical protein [Desulfothermus sp.]
MTNVTQSDNTTHQIPPEILEEYLKKYVSKFIKKELEQFVLLNEQRAKELSLMERVIRVEEELKALREMDAARFEAMDKKFNALLNEIAARFEATDKRFEALHREMNARFEAVDKRFEAMDKRFEALHREMDARFNAMDKRLTFLQWFLGIGFSAVLCVTSLMPLWLKLLFHLS